jgi:hypothetical protein
MCTRYDLALVGVVQDSSVLLAALRDTLKEESKKELQDAKDTTFPLTTAIIGLLRMASWQLMGPLVPAIFHAPTRRVLGISPEKEKWLQVHCATVACIATLVGFHGHFSFFFDVHRGKKCPGSYPCRHSSAISSRV